MDTGLNNTNKLHLALDQPMLADVEWLVEANSNETHQLWSDWSERSLSNYKPVSTTDDELRELLMRVAKTLPVEDLKTIRKLAEVNKRVSKIDHKRYKWEQVHEGHGFEILRLDVKLKGKKKESLLVMIDFRYFIIEGHKIAFYSSESMATHRGYIETFLVTYFQRTHDKYGLWNHTDAQNFHNCINYLDHIDPEPRDTSHKVSRFKEYHIFPKI